MHALRWLRGPAVALAVLVAMCASPIVTGVDATSHSAGAGLAASTPAAVAPANPVATANTAVAALPEEPAGNDVVLAGARTLAQLDPASVPYAGWPTTVVRNVPYTTPVDCGGYSCQLPLDIYVPGGPGPHPAVVLLRGGPGTIGSRNYLADYALYLASLGLLVFSPDTRDMYWSSGGYPVSFQDASCAVRFARARSAAYGGDAGPLTFVGHSFGAYIGAMLSLNATEYASAACLFGGSGRPDAFVGFAGCYDVGSEDVASEFGTFFGGWGPSTNTARAAANPMGVPLSDRIPVRILAGTLDVSVDPHASAMLTDYLARRGWNVALALVPGANHMTVLDSVEGRNAVLGAIALAQATRNAIDPVVGASGS
jgi:acetyl esterase/lipase